MENEMKVLLDGKELTMERFLEKKTEVEKKPGVKIIEVRPGVYKTKIQG